MDASPLKFARIDFLGEGKMKVFASDKPIDIDNWYNINWTNIRIFELHGNSLIIPHLQNFTKYYVYLYSTHNGNYKIMLTFSYSS